MAVTVVTAKGRKLSIENGVNFSCPDCKEKVGLISATADEDGAITFLAFCETCEGTLCFPLEGIQKNLRGKVN